MSDPSKAFDDEETAVLHLEGRGYSLTDNGNWLPPNSIHEPSVADFNAADYLMSHAEYGGIVKLLPCPFCGGRADPFSPLGPECTDCGGSAPDLSAWQARV
jgi:hypothetical protein